VTDEQGPRTPRPGPLSRLLPAVGQALQALGAGRGAPVATTPAQRVTAGVRQLVADSQVLHDLAAERVGRNDHTMREFVGVRDRLTDDLVGEEGTAARVELSVRFDDPEQCVRMVRLVGGGDLLTIQGFDAYRYARVESRTAERTWDELFLVVSATGAAGADDGAPRIVAVLPLDPDTLQWEDALRGGSPQAWLREFEGFVAQDAGDVAHEVRRARET
jgi:hypothetical protein